MQKKSAKKSGCPLWQFVILDLSSFGMIITEPSGLLYLALHERNLKHILKHQSLQPRPCTMSVSLRVWSLDGFLLFNYFIALWQEFLAIPWDLIGMQGSFCLRERLNRSFFQ